MNSQQNEGKSQMSKTSFRKVFKQRSNQSLEDGRRSLLAKLDKNVSVSKLKTKLGLAPSKLEQSEMQETLQKINFVHHNPEECLCGSCDCGRHLCRLNVVRPQMIKKTSYKSHFPLKTILRPERLIQGETQPLKASHLDLKTVYKNQFNSNAIQVTKPQQPLDNIRSSGTIQSFTTYQNQFKNFKVPNQYIKPTDRHSREHFPFRSHSVYSRDFTSKNMDRSQSLKSLDQLKLGKLWFGQTTYNRTFLKPKSQHHLQPLPAQIQKMNKTLDDKLRFKTSYKSEFIEKMSQICPSKKQILQQSGKYTDLKGRMNENGDFKTMSPEFHAISTSKHFYV